MFSTSCSDFLDITPTSKYTTDNLYQTVDQAKMSVNGIYNALVDEALYGRNVTMYYDVDTDVSQITGGNSTGKPDGERRSIAHYAFNSATKQLDNAWTAYYAGIERANILIDEIPKMELYNNGSEEEQKELKRIYGEGLTLRAIMYFDLVRLWGDVPFKTTPSAAGENFDLPRTPRDTIYDSIISDMIKAVDLVPWADEVDANERLTKGAVKGILARVCLHAAGYSLRWNLETNDAAGMKMATRDDPQRIRELYTIARNQLKDIIDKGIHKLNPSYENVWKNICSYKYDSEYRENLFELGFYSTLLEKDESGSYGYYMGPKSAIESKWGHGKAGVWAMPNFYLSFKSGDVRKDVSIMYLKFNSNTVTYKMDKGQPTELFDITPAKWRKMWASDTPSSYTNFNYPMLRYSDVLLMFAEADSWLANAKTDEAEAALKEVRLRAFPDDTATINAETYPGDFEGFLNVIIDERAFELAFEGFRKFDLIRWNKLASKIQDTKTEIEALKACYVAGGSGDPLLPYNGSISWRVGTTFPRSVYNRDNGGDFVEVDFSGVKPSTGTWTVSSWLNNKFADGMAQFAIGFEENRTELYPVPTTILNVSPSLTQLPSY